MRIYNVKINTMKGAVIEKGWVEVLDSKITAVQEGAPVSTAQDDIDGEGGLRSSGFIDAQRH